LIRYIDVDDGLLKHPQLNTLKQRRSNEATCFWLVVWNICYDFPYIGHVIIPIDFHIFQKVNHQPVFFFPDFRRKASWVVHLATVNSTPEQMEWATP